MTAGGWWRRNGVALGLSVVLAGTAAWVISARQWEAYFGYAPTQPVSAPQGQPVELGGAVFTLTDARTHPLAGLGDVPPGTQAVIVTIDVAASSGGATPEGCLIRLRETGGTHGTREWVDDAFGPVPVAEGTTTYCDPDATGDYVVELPFLIPDDADGALEVTVQMSEELPRYAALPLDPLR